MFLLSKTRHCLTDSSLIETVLFLYYTPIKAAEHSVGLPYTFASNPSVVVPRWRCSSELADNTPQTWEYSIRNLKKEALYIKYYRLGLFCNKVNLPNEPYSTINMGDTTTDRLHTTFRYYRISKQCSEVKNMRSNKPGSQWQCESQIWCSRDSWDVHCPDRSVKEIPPVTM